MMPPECSLKQSASISNPSVSFTGNPILKALSMALIVGHSTPLLLKNELVEIPQEKQRSKYDAPTNQRKVTANLVRIEITELELFCAFFSHLSFMKGAILPTISSNVSLSTQNIL